MEYSTTFRFQDRTYTADLQSGISVARCPDIVDQDFDPADPSVQRMPFQQPGFTGDVAAGGSCNVDVLQINPHCSMTHTETLLHLVDRTQWPLEKISTASIPSPILMPCLVIHCPPVTGAEAIKSNQTYRPDLNGDDLVVSGDSMATALDSVGMKLQSVKSPFALLIKTALQQQWDFHSGEPVPFLSHQAMALIASSRCRHLLVDFPSVDRRDDDGMLSNHRQFWNVPSDHDANEDSIASFRTDRTITEMVDLPQGLTDGVYLLDLPLIPLNTDATLSRPVLFRAIA